MLTVYKHEDGELISDTTVADATKGSWINLVNPDPDELALVNIMTEIPTDVLKTALDMEERSHVEIEENYIFVVINIPALRGSDSYDTVPLGIFLTPDFFITVCLEESEVLYPFLNNQVATFYTYKKHAFYSKSCIVRPLCSCVICNKLIVVRMILKFSYAIQLKIKTFSSS